MNVCEKGSGGCSVKSTAVGGSIPCACQDWAAVKAAYRFLADPRVTEAGLLAGHFEAARARARVQATPGTILILHDTMEFVFHRESAAEFGLLGRPCLDPGRQPGRQWRQFTLRGLLMHSSMAVTLQGVPLGLTAAKFWSRKQFKLAFRGRRHWRDPERGVRGSAANVRSSSTI